MRAIVVRKGGGPDVLTLEEVPDPEPGRWPEQLRELARKQREICLRHPWIVEVSRFAYVPLISMVAPPVEKPSLGHEIEIEGAFLR